VAAPSSSRRARGGGHSVKTGRAEQDHKRWKKRQEISNLEFGYPGSKQQARNAEPRSVLAVRTLACAHVGEAPVTVPRASIAVREIQSHQSHSRREVLIGPFHWLSSYGGRGCCCSHDRGHHLRHRKAPLEVLGCVIGKKRTEVEVLASRIRDQTMGRRKGRKNRTARYDLCKMFV